MKMRCAKKPEHAIYARYGGRGIAVCDEWLESFEAFLRDVGPRPSPDHSIDRIDNDRGYELGNVRWATAVEQATNRHTTHWLEARGKRQTITQWAREVGLPPGTLNQRIAAGWPIERAFTFPLRKQERRP